MTLSHNDFAKWTTVVEKKGGGKHRFSFYQ